MSEQIKEKIAHLMAMGNDERTNKFEFEAEAALRQAAKLMRLHNIVVAELAARTGSKPVYNWVSVNVPIFTHNGQPSQSPISWLGSIGAGIARFTDTSVSWNRHHEHGYCLKFSGDTVDVEYAVWLTKHLRDDIRRASKAYGGGTKANNSFRHGMVNRICERMRLLTEENKRELMKAQTSTGTALMVVETKIAQRDAHFGAPEYGKSKKRAVDHSMIAGIVAGDKVGLGRPIGQQSVKQLEGV